ncbi:unnamed protein product (macronuclear) [Paramecium tetraurelia]|uniref:Phospholipase/carboxylesterase/thioesterase domain-containing protein n=1 Tax=Paramecium tetraurelia TaxID=5888 RepID=A0DCL3_PARTE|nr:uncharacterized protein GSPATT00015659001 [Paramecium tetraurelia]CAK80780.1 unnamed protein product [Paramecium tetraurelia]|eukprot:XP_001448177.1 hypothetical protein (macronuclear) [Paramecium tetraurelia strain d4-2]
MGDQDSSHVTLIVLSTILIGIYLFVLFILHCFGKINDIIFPAPTPMYQEINFQANLYYASTYDYDVNMGKTKINIVHRNPNVYPGNPEKVRNIPYVYIKNRYWKTNLYIIYFHGNAEDMCRYSAVEFMESLSKMISANMFVIEYPGYGIYRNIEPTSNLVEQDSLVLYDEIKNQFRLNDDQIYIFGRYSQFLLRSIGTGPSFYLATQRNIKGLITMSAYKSIRYILNDFCYGCGCILSLLCCLPNIFPNLERSQHIRCPIALIHGEEDALIQPHHSQDIFENLPLHIQQQSSIFVRPRMTHNYYDIEYDIAIPISQSFIDLQPKGY